MWKKMLFALSLAVALSVISGRSGAADAIQDAYAAYEQAVAPLRERLAAKHAELAALHDGDQRDDDKAKRLFAEIAEVNGQLYTAREDLRAKMREAGAPEAGYGMHHRGGYGFAPEGGGYSMHRGYGDGHMRRGGHMGGHGGHRGGWDW